MSKSDYTMLLALPLSQINKPDYRKLVDQYAGEIASPCIAEGLKKALGEPAK
ncbi:hypothetical protein QSV36_03680 [Pseudomonas sp. BCRC 81390]|uniref:hypothetical protein n=1 Tax=Pseudomonas sp. BCRC 81390 TaxID=3054778 RepID=UPI0025995C2D|nr:hypothetical protein [Pseudomonas sp. BCRC 81390]MDM3884699.1 hypothetical protein [Pseudomonas sp. BCRC 81390]